MRCEGPRMVGNWGSWRDCRSCKFASRSKFLSALPPDTYHLSGKLGGKLGGKHGKKNGELGGNYNNISKEERREYGKLGGNTGNISREERRDFGQLGSEFGKLGSEFGKRGKQFGKLGGNLNNVVVNAERKAAAARVCEECSHCRRSLLREKFWPCDWRNRKSKGITCKECSPGEPKERRATKAKNNPIPCKACQNTLPRSEFRPDVRGKYKIREGMICEKCREAGKLDGRGRKRKRIDK